MAPTDVFGTDPLYALNLKGVQYSCALANRNATAAMIQTLNNDALNGKTTGVYALNWQQVNPAKFATLWSQLTAGGFTQGVNLNDSIVSVPIQVPDGATIGASDFVTPPTIAYPVVTLPPADVDNPIGAPIPGWAGFFYATKNDQRPVGTRFFSADGHVYVKESTIMFGLMYVMAF